MQGSSGKVAGMWRRFRTLPLAAQLVLWVIAWWLLFFLWAGSLSGRPRVTALAVGLATLVMIGVTGGDEPTEKPTIVAADGERRSAERVEDPVATSTTSSSTTTSTLPEITTTTTTTTAAAPAAASTATTTPRTTVTTARPTTTTIRTTTTRATTATTRAPSTSTTVAASGSYVTPGAYCGSSGATGSSKNGVPMTCSTQSCAGEAYDKPRWRRTTC